MPISPVRSLVLVPLCLAVMAVGPLQAQETTSILVRFGLLDTAETRWDGSVSVSAGELLGASDWHPRPENSVDSAGTWQFSTHKGVNYNWRAYENLPDRPVEIYYWTPGVVLDLRAAAGAQVSILTAQGDFVFPLADARLGESLEFLDGAAVVERVPTVEKLSTGAYEDDFVAVLDGSEGRVRTAWVAYRDGANEILTSCL